MRKTIIFTLTKNDYKKILLSQRFNKKFFILVYLAFFIIHLSNIIENYSWSKFVAIFLMISEITFFFFAFLYLVITIYSNYVYKRDPILKSQITINFHEQDLQEITPYSTIKIKYKDIYKTKLLKSELILYISPVRGIIIPKNTNYDIKEIYSEIKQIKDN